LTSSDRAGFAERTLLTLQKFDNVPTGITVVDASRIMSRSRLTSLYESGKKLIFVQQSGGVKLENCVSPVICLLADYIRLTYAREVASRGQDITHVCVCDCDTIWLRKWDSWGRCCGHEVASGRQNPAGFMRAFQNTSWKKDLVMNYGRAPRDGLRVCMPLQFPVGSPLLPELLDDIKGVCPEDGVFKETKFLCVMNATVQVLNKHGCRAAIADPEVFSILPWYGKLGTVPRVAPNQVCMYVYGMYVYVCMFMYIDVSS